MGIYCFTGIIKSVLLAVVRRDNYNRQTLGSEKQEKDEERLQEELEKLSKLMEASEVEKIDLKGQIGSLESKARKSAIELSTVRARLCK